MLLICVRMYLMHVLPCDRAPVLKGYTQQQSCPITTVSIVHKLVGLRPPTIFIKIWKPNPSLIISELRLHQYKFFLKPIMQFCSNENFEPVSLVMWSSGGLQPPRWMRLCLVCAVNQYILIFLVEPSVLRLSHYRYDRGYLENN
jgi:hypothetical protein